MCLLPNLIDILSWLQPSFVGIKKMGFGAYGGNYYIGNTKDNQPTDFYSRDECIGILYDPYALLKEFGLVHGNPISEKTFQRLCGGLHPITSAPLLKNINKHRAGVDIAPAAPKSFSSLWAASPLETRTQLEAINSIANNAALEHLNKHACFTRKGKHGLDHVQAKFAGVQFQHGTSRENDPHLHIHNTIFNLTNVDGKWRTLEMSHLMAWQTSANSLYQAALIRGLQEINIEIVKIKHHFEITGVPAALLAHWSTRSKQIDKAANDEGLAIDDLGGRNRIHRETRKGKSVIQENHHDFWKQVAARFGFFSEDIGTRQRPVTRTPLSNQALLNEIATAIKEIHKTVNIFTENDFHRSLTEKLYGQDLDTINQIIASVKFGRLKIPGFGKIINLGEQSNSINRTRYLSTEFMANIENKIATLVRRMDNDRLHKITELHTVTTNGKIPNLTKTQLLPLAHATSSGSLKIIEAASDTRGYFPVRAVMEIFEHAGYQVHIVTPNKLSNLAGWSSVDQSNDKTAGEIFRDVRNGGLSMNSKTLLIIKKCGQVSTVEMYALLSLSLKHHCKIILTDDEAQLSPIAASPAMRIILQNVKLIFTENITHKKDEWQRLMIQQFRSRKAAEGLKLLDAHAQLKCLGSRHLQLDQLIEDWNTWRADNKGKQLLILAMNNNDVHKLNLMAHQHMRESGDLTGPDFIFTCDAKKGRTRELPFAIGDMVSLNRKDTRVEVSSNDKGQISHITYPPDDTHGYLVTVTLSNGRSIDLDTKYYIDHKSGGFAISHGYATSKCFSNDSTVQRTFVMADTLDWRYSYASLSRQTDMVTLYVNAALIESQLRTQLENLRPQTISSSKKEASNVIEKIKQRSSSVAPIRSGPGHANRLRKLSECHVPTCSRGSAVLLQRDAPPGRQTNSPMRWQPRIGRTGVIKALALQMDRSGTPHLISDFNNQNVQKTNTLTEEQDNLNDEKIGQAIKDIIELAKMKTNAARLWSELGKNRHAILDIGKP